MKTSFSRRSMSTALIGLSLAMAFVVSVMSETSFAQTNRSCRGDSCFRGRVVTFTNPIMQGIECGRGIAFVSSYCASGTRQEVGQKECLDGKFLVCRFCSHMNDSVLATKITVDPKTFRSDDGCQALYNMQPGELRTRLSEDQFNSIKNALLERIVLVQNTLEAIGDMVNVSTMTEESEVSARARAMNELRNLIKGAGGLRETLDQLGSSRTSTKTSQVFDQIDKQLFSPFETASFTLRDENDFQVWQEMKTELVKKYGEVGMFIFDNFNFTPESR